MTDQKADFAMNYRVTFTVIVTDPELLLMKAREMEADMCQWAPKFPQKWAVKIP
jgi:hypothetical protein